LTQRKDKAAAGEPVILGRISGLYGVKGWVRVFSYTEPREALLDYRSWLLRTADGWMEQAVAEGRKQGKSLVARLGCTEDREAAAEWIGVDVAVARESMPPAAGGEFYWADLEGLKVRHRDGRILGRVAYMLATGANDVMVVQGESEPKQEILIPFVLEMYILRVDVAEGVIDVDWEWD
jgi:16S rRNA processing protein RimM